MTDKPYQRHHTAVCHGDAALGLFMYRLTRFLASASKPAKFVDDFGIRREGIAQTWATWADELGITLKQFRRVLEKGEDLGFAIRAQRAWGPYRVNRMHVAVTKSYVAELARCVSLGPTAYLVEIKAERAMADCPTGHSQIAQLGKDTLPAVGKALNSSHTLHPTYSKTAVADATREPENCVPGEEKKDHEPSAILPDQELQETKSPPTPHAHTVQIDAEYGISFGEAGSVTTTSVDLADKLSVPTVTGEGLARKLYLLGVLEDWKVVCADNGALAAHDITDDQLAALDQLCGEQISFGHTPPRPEAMRMLLGNVAVRCGVYSAGEAFVTIIDEGTYPTLVEEISALLRLPEPADKAA
jgi:hypothetical protein